MDGDEIRFALEGYGEEHTWMSFGVPESETNPRMIGSDVTVAGILNDGQGFTHDYYLQTKNQCSYTASKPEGVCPDTLLPQGQDQVRLVTHERKGNVNFVAWARKVSPGGRWDRALKLGERAYVWAYGPLSLPSTAERAIVL